MLTIEGLIAVISLCATLFSLGYSLGRNSKTQKITAQSREYLAVIFDYQISFNY